MFDFLYIPSLNINRELILGCFIGFYVVVYKEIKQTQHKINAHRVISYNSQVSH